MGAAEMPTAMVAAAAEMPAAVTPSVSTTMTAAALRSGISGDRQCARQNNCGNPDMEFCHGTPERRRLAKLRRFGRTLAS
jgi:hypothetical protein